MIESSAHKQLILGLIIKTAMRTIFASLIVGLFFLAPSLLRDNAFSATLAVLGKTIIIAGSSYALVVAIKKWLSIKNSFSDNNSNS